MRKYLVQRWFLLLLISALIGGCTSWRSAQPLLEWKWLRDGTVAGVLFLMALPLDASLIWNAVRYPLPSALAVLTNMVFIPLLTWAVSLLFEPSLGHGLLVAAATPCTLASASVWTRRAGGNDAVSIIVTVVTNLTCFAWTPFWLWLTTGNRVASQAVSFAALGYALATVVVLPMTVAQLLRLVPRIAAWSTHRKLLLNTCSQFGVLLMVFLGSAQMGATMSSRPVSVWLTSVPSIVAVVLAIHLAGFYIGWQLARWCRLSRENRIAVGFAGSQKTLMVGLRVSMELGVSIFPMVAYHVTQLIADTMLAERLAEPFAERSSNSPEEAPATTKPLEQTA